MNTTTKTALITLIFFCGIVAGAIATNIASAASEQDKDIFKSKNANLSTEPDGWSVRALTNLTLDLTQAANGESEHSKARKEALVVLEELRGLNIAGKGRVEGYRQASRFFNSLEKYVSRRDGDDNAVESCRAASRLFKALSKMSEDGLPDKVEAKEGAKFFYALADILKLERKDREPERATRGEIEFFTSLGDVTQAESTGSEKESKKAVAKMFRALGTLATEGK
jgi:hypothetical protein